jgi:surface polysaccharide O-acyltransferase-like enzyme
MQNLEINIKQKNRSTNVELLRVLCMFLIVVIHYVYHGLGRTGYYTSFDMHSINDALRYITLEPLWVLALTAVNCYVMITGYFLVEKRELRWKGILRTIIQTLFYALIIFCLFAVFDYDFPLATLKRVIIPIHSDYYWFVTSYIGLLFVAPFLSILATSLSKRQYQYLLIVLFVLNFEFLYGTVYSHQRGLLWFSYLYLIAGYLKLHGTPLFIIKHKGAFFISTWILLALFATMYNSLTWPLFKLKGSDYNGPVFFLSLAIFIYFVNTSFKRGSLLTKAAPYTFGVYLIHDNPMVRRVVWGGVISDSIKIPIIIHCIIVCLIIFVVCILIDFLRAQLFHMLKVNEVMDKLSLKLPLL